jgi:hypothetical protein
VHVRGQQGAASLQAASSIGRCSVLARHLQWDDEDKFVEVLQKCM